MDSITAIPPNSFYREVNREHGQAAVDQLIRELQLDRIFDFKPGTHLDGGLAK